MTLAGDFNRPRRLALGAAFLMLAVAVSASAQEAAEVVDPVVGVWAFEGQQIELRADGTWVQLPDQGPSEQAVLCEQLGSGDVAAGCVGHWRATEAGYELDDPHLYNLEGDQPGCGCSYRTAGGQLEGDQLTVTPGDEEESLVMVRVVAE